MKHFSPITLKSTPRSVTGSVRRAIQERRKHIAIGCVLLLILACLIPASAAGGRITGKVVDPRGAPVAGAAVVITNLATKQTFNTTTDNQGQYKIEGLPAGNYLVSISAKGFSEVRRESIKVEEGASATVDARLEIAPITTEAVEISGAAAKGNTDSVYQKLRQQAKEKQFSGSAATVNNLVLKRDAATFTLRSGELYFLAPVEGRTTSAVFIGEGELTLTPPTEIEKRSLATFTEQPSITEQFTQLVLRFTDKTFEEVKASPNVTMSGAGGAQGERALEIYRSNQELFRKQLRSNMEIRTLADIYSPQRPGYFMATIKGRRYDKLLYVVDPLGIPDVSPEEVALLSYGETSGGIWTAFHLADEYGAGTAASSEDNRIFDITHHEIDGAIHGTLIAASDRITLRPLVQGARVLPFDLYRSLRVKRVQDEQGRDLDFIQESKDEDADFAVILPQAPQPGKDYKLVVQYEGKDALRDSGGGNFFLVPRSTWYPNNAGTQFGDRAIFDMTFRYPKSNTFVATGAPLVPDTQEGDLMVSRWSSGNVELAVAGFNYGRFKKKTLEDKTTGYNLEFYANEEVPDALKAMQLGIEREEQNRVNSGASGPASNTTLGSISTTKMADASLIEAQNSTRIFSAYFGKLPYTRVAMSQQPAGNFGQAWPTLVFMPYTAYMDATQRRQLLGSSGNTSSFWTFVGPHEIAHQWWGHMLGWSSYHDQWMSEGFAEFSASLYAQFVLKDFDKFIDFWEDQRKLIVEARPATRGLKPYTVGPVTQGYRLNSAKTGNIARFMIYPKGAYILHMLRMLMYDGTDKRFQLMMKEFIQSHLNKDASTEDLKQIVEKHMTPEMNIEENGRMDWFFNAWVYGSEIPSYRFEYQISGNTVSGRITQSGVSKDFGMLVPIYADFGKGWTRLGTAKMFGNASVELGNIQLPQQPRRMAICALNDVLAVSIENVKR